MLMSEAIGMYWFQNYVFSLCKEYIFSKNFTPKIRSKVCLSHAIICHLFVICIQMQNINNKLSCPNPEGTMDQLPPHKSYPTCEMLLRLVYLCIHDI